MILGISTPAFTLFHVVVSLIAIVTGIIVAVTMLGSKTTNGWTAIFLATTALTSITGFLFQRDQVLPSHIVGAVSLLVLIIAIAALYGYRLARSWRWIYVVSALVALYLNVFVLVAQAFLKGAILNAMAPTQTDPGFIVAQLLPLVFLQHCRGGLDNWDPTVPVGLAHGRPVILFNNAGVASSSGETPNTIEAMGDHLAAFLNALGLPQVDVLGFSIGGYVAQSLVLAHPHLVRRLVLAGTGPRNGEPRKNPRVSEVAANPVPVREDFLFLFFSPSEASHAAGRAFCERRHQR